MYELANHHTMGNQSSKRRCNETKPLTKPIEKLDGHNSLLKLFSERILVIRPKSCTDFDDLHSTATSFDFRLSYSLTDPHKIASDVIKCIMCKVAVGRPRSFVSGCREPISISLKLVGEPLS